MAPHEEHEENQDGQSEVVVILVADDTFERFALQLGRSEGLDAHLAKKTAAPVDHLEAVAVDQANRCVLRDEHAAMIDVADDATGLVDHAKSSGGIGGRADKKAPVCTLEIDSAALGAVKVVNVLAPGDFWHQEPDRDARACH